jgi:large subunit ribosomal protein L13
MKYTKPTKASDIKRGWYEVDVKGEILGRQATDIAHKLIGKSKPNFVGHLDLGDHVIVINAKNVKVTGNKFEDKIYTRYSGYPSGLKEEKFKNLIARKPKEVIQRAVAGMLPKNKLRKKRLARLYVYPGSEHPHKDKLKHVKNQ